MNDSIYPSTAPEIEARRKQVRSLTAGFELDSGTLLGEHALLLRDLRRRTTPVLVLIETRTWPAAELQTLVRFLRSVVLRQVSDEERLPIPSDSTAAPFAELTMDHARLHSLTEHLDRLTVTPCAMPELAALIEELLAPLERHLTDEGAVFGSLTSEWFPHGRRDDPVRGLYLPGRLSN
jgi:hypothetical protein